MSVRLSLEKLEARECPAFTRTFTPANGHLRIAFDNEGATGQSVVISSYQGRVTLNERATKLLASSVKRITVIGSELDNTIDLHFVSTGTGFRALNGKVRLYGNGGDDVLDGTQFGDQLYGGDGFDQLHAQRGDDYLDGGAGDDWNYHGPGADTIVVGNGNDYLEILEPIDKTVPAGANIG